MRYLYDLAGDTLFKFMTKASGEVLCAVISLLGNMTVSGMIQ